MFSYLVHGLNETAGEDDEDKTRQQLEDGAVQPHVGGEQQVRPVKLGDLIMELSSQCKLDIGQEGRKSVIMLHLWVKG